MSTHALVLSLVSDPHSAYTHPTDALERAVSVIRASYGGSRETPIYLFALQRAEDAIAAVLRARRSLDRDAIPPVLQPAPVAPLPPTQPPDRGWHAPKRPAPIQPRGPVAVADLL